jgi:uncharacterized repeat protein (TIGR03803 family)
MKTSKGTLLAKAISLTWGLILAHHTWAQTFTTLHTFTAGPGGSSPNDGLVLSSNTLYGTTYFDAFGNGSAIIHGTVYAMSASGLTFTNVHDFPSYNEITPTNYDGNGPIAGLTMSGRTLYGTTVAGGTFGDGTVFAVNSDGTGFTGLHDFNRSSDGGDLRGRLLLSGNTLYGTAGHGGSADCGTVFSLRTNGTGFTVLHNFTGGDDGAYPYGYLILSGNTLYGTASDGLVPPMSSGTVFGLNVDGTSFKVLHTFTSSFQTNANSDGITPFAGLILSGTTLYGLATYGGSGGSGTVFAMNTDGTAFTVLHNFTALPQQSPPQAGTSLPATNSDGAFPHGGLILSNNTLYGAAGGGGTWGQGTVFAINTDGTAFTVLHTFKGSSDGSGPNGNLILSGNTLYGTALFGGSSGADGTVFSISLSPQPTIVPSGSNVILSWPTNYAGFDYAGYALQSTATIASPTWTTVSPPPVVVNGQYTVTNPISASQQFFRLRQ